MKLTQEHIDAMILNVETIKMGEKTTVVLVTLTNGFELVGSSSCVDPADYDQEVGESLALAKILDQIWLLEGYLLHTDGYSPDAPALFEGLSFNRFYKAEPRLGFMLEPGEVSSMFPLQLFVQVFKGESNLVMIFEDHQEILRIDDIEPGPDDVEELKARLRAFRPTTNAT